MTVRSNNDACLGPIVISLFFLLFSGAALAQETPINNCLTCHGGDPSAAGFDGMAKHLHPSTQSC